jgi:hypothetical protein
MGLTITKKIPLTPQIVKEKIDFENSLDFQAQFEDFHLKPCILVEIRQPTTSGKIRLFSKGCPPAKLNISACSSTP